MQNTQMSNDMRESASHVASGVKTAGKFAKKVHTSKVGKAARKGIVAVWKALPISVRIGIISIIALLVLFAGIMTTTPALISNATLHQNDPEALSDGHDIGYYGTAEDDVELLKSVSEDVNNIISDVLGDSMTADEDELRNVADANGWTLDMDKYSRPTELQSKQQMLMLYSEYSASVHNEITDEAFNTYQQTTAKKDIEKKLRSLIKEKSETYPYGNKLNGADFQRNEDGTIYIRAETVSDEDGESYTIYYVIPIVYAPDYNQVSDDAFLPEGVTSESPYIDEETDVVDGLTDEAIVSIYGTYGDAALRMSRVLGEILYGEDFWGDDSVDSGIDGAIFGRSNQDVVNFALAEFQEGPHVGGHKYCKEFGYPDGTAWCALFVSYCMKQCGYVSSGIFTPSASCAGLHADFVRRNIWHPRESGYIPKAGDVIIFHWTGWARPYNHTGIVVSCDGTTVYTIEGNTSNQVHTRKYRMNSSEIVGYGTPDYPVIEGKEADHAA